MLHSQFQAKSSIWSPHCGLVSFSSDISITESIISICGRIISATISHSSDAFEPFSITVVYFPASRSERFRFLSTILTDFRSVFSSSPSRSIILGDFNYTYSNASSSRNRQAPPRKPSSSITFQRGVSQSCIDYILSSHDLASSIDFDNCHTSYIQPAWSDHFLISSQVRPHPASDTSSASAVGKGSLEMSWHTRCILVSSSEMGTPQIDHCKCRKFVFPTAQGLSQKLNADPSLHPVLNPQLKIVEAQLASLQSYHVDTLALRSGIRWRERGKTSAGFLKRSVDSRVSKKLISPLIHPTSLSRCTTKEEMLDAAATFYTDLYSPDAIDPQAIYQGSTALLDNQGQSTKRRYAEVYFK
ncbi:hypothetical protein BD408DRAFT_437070 [Parasitella parasitica]|nr:hypothetical protein BD408DRAFT_437070 [Parasitella parasitica]